ncbi:uncharacterized protein F4807DRAFT_459186 [Annulohypoxylon truncatum]|uniref:uncharacterized protein n=1 Tax=Annulohypoxylon truncatum TaxID=327061 RepID=UPI0020082CCC|nr:uncharacterized protein F4807DRAFT_459186 [Annulohypoxylon truncatum]KAI1210958.1 hypothetical protein F4807DRAFT_459186 [Annulohypoxylon truncatum]
MDRRSMSPNHGSNPEGSPFFNDDSTRIQLPQIVGYLGDPTPYGPVNIAEPMPIRSEGLRPMPTFPPIASPEYSDSNGLRTHFREQYTQLRHAYQLPFREPSVGGRRIRPTPHPDLLELWHAQSLEGPARETHDSFPGPLQPRHILLGERPPSHNDAEPARREPYTPPNRAPAPQQQQQEQLNQQDRMPHFGPLSEGYHLRSPILAPARRGEDSDEWSGTTAVGSNWSWERNRGGQETLDLGERAGGEAQRAAPEDFDTITRWPSPASFRVASPNPGPNPEGEEKSGDNGPRAVGGDEPQGPGAATDQARTTSSEQEQEQEQERERGERDVGTDPITRNPGPVDGENHGTPEHDETNVEQPENRVDSPGQAENVVSQTRIWIEGDVHIMFSSTDGFERWLQAIPSTNIQGNVYIRMIGQKRKRGEDSESEDESSEDDDDDDDDDMDGYEVTSEDS